MAPSIQESAAETASDSSTSIMDLRVQLASVTRALEWAAVRPERVDRAPWLGTSCARRLDAVAASGGGEPVEALAQRLRALDEAVPGERFALVGELLSAVAAVSPLSTAGARVMGLPERGRLVQPRRRRRKEKDRQSPEVEVEVEVEAESKAEQSAAETGPPVSGDEGAAPEAEEAEPAAGDASTAATEQGRSRRRSRKGRRSEARPAEPVVRVLPLGHPDGTGADLSQLGMDADLVGALAAAGLATQADVLLLRPSGHDRSPMARSDAGSEVSVTVRGRVVSRHTVLAPHGRRRSLSVESPALGRVTCRWLAPEAPRGWDTWDTGAEVAVVGVVGEGEDGLVMYEAETVGIDGRGSGLLPRYGVPGVDDREMRDVVARVLGLVRGSLEDPLPAGLRERHRLLDLDEALADAHFPSNTGGRGRLRMAFEELLLMQLGVAWRAGRGQPARGISHKVAHKAIGQLDALHSLRLDDAQEIAFSEIRRDLGRSRPMARLLQGDVGAGKGLVCLLSALVVAEGGGQVAMIAPDPLAAERTFLYADGLLRSVGIASLLVGDRVNHAQADALRRGEAQVVFGTRSLLAADVAWKRLGLVIAEERGPYGTVTSGQLVRGKGPSPDLLVTTRVPIPSSLTFTVFGDLDVSVVRAAVPPRCVATVLPSTDRQEAYRRVREQIEAGRQAFIVLPVRDGRDLLGYADAMRMAEALQGDLLKGTRIGVYSTDMTRDERSRAFDDFQHRRIDVLVCTTYIEDAPTVANATQMLVEYADLHDAVRLHRLRGHVGFGHRTGASYFVLSDSPAAGSAERVERVAGEADGFRLAELDLGARGAEALLGDRASEMPAFRWATPEADRDLLLRARQEAMDIISTDGELRRVPELASAVTARWGEWLGQALPEPSPRSGGDGRSRRRRRRRRR